MKYLKTYELFGVWTEDLIELEDILRDLEDDGIRVDVNHFDGINVYLTNSKTHKHNSFDAPDSFPYTQIKHNIEHLVSYLEENGYQLDSVYNIIDLKPFKFEYPLSDSAMCGRLEFRFKMKKTNEGIFDFFKKKLSDDDKIVQIYIDRLEKVDGISPYEIEYNEKNVVEDNDGAVAMRYHINFHDTPITILKAVITSPNHNRYATDTKQEIIDNGGIFKDSRTFYALHLPHQNEDIMGSWKKLDELWELAKETYEDDEHSSRIKRIRDEINPAEGMMEYLVHNFKVNDNKYWFEVRDPKDDKGYSVGWGVGELEDDDISKFNRTDRFEQFQIFSEVKRQFNQWFNETNPDRFYFSVPGEKRMNIYITGIMGIIGDEFEYEIQKTDYKPFDLREKNVYYVLFRRKGVSEAIEYGTHGARVSKELQDTIKDIIIELEDDNLDVTYQWYTSQDVAPYVLIETKHYKDKLFYADISETVERIKDVAREDGWRFDTDNGETWCMLIFIG